MNNKSPAAILFALFVAVAGLSAPQSAGAQGCINDRYGNPFCPPAGSGCVTDQSGQIKCSPPDGGITMDRYQNPVCGPGQCATNRLGEVFCSTQAKGYATVNQDGDAVCTGGCIPASAAACITPTK